MIAQITLHELRVLMRSPFAWLAAGLLQLLFGWLFLSAVERYIEMQAIAATATSSGISSHLIVNFFAPISIIFMVATPLLCMHLIAGDKQANRFNFLLSLPVTASQLVLGKFLGATIFQSVVLLLGAALVSILSFSIELDTTHLVTAGAGLILFICTTSALTLFYSSLSNRPVLAAFLSFVTMILLWTGAAMSNNGLIQFASPSAHLHSFMQGLLDSRDVVYFIAVISILLTLGIWRFDTQRARNHPA